MRTATVEMMDGKLIVLDNVCNVKTDGDVVKVVSNSGDIVIVNVNAMKYVSIHSLEVRG